MEELSIHKTIKNIVNDESIIDAKDINNGSLIKKYDLIKPIDCITNKQTPIPINLCDLLNFHSIDLSQMDYCEIDELDNLEIGLHHIYFWNISFDLLMSICDYDKKNKILYFTDSFFINNNKYILSFLLFYSNIFINVETKNKQRYPYKFNLVTTYINDKYKNKLKSDKTEHSYMINTFTTNISLNSNKILIDNMMSIKGLYLLGNKIKNIKLVIKNDIFFDYNHNFIKKIGIFKKDVSISIAKKNIYKYLPIELVNEIMSYLEQKYLYYIPISIKNDEYLNICRFENVNLLFDKEYNGKVIGYGRNFINQAYGIINLMFN